MREEGDYRGKSKWEEGVGGRDGDGDKRGMATGKRETGGGGEGQVVKPGSCDCRLFVRDLLACLCVCERVFVSVRGCIGFCVRLCAFLCICVRLCVS